MAYNLRFTTSFSSTSGQSYTVQILQKDFAGVPRSVTGVSELHGWDEDNPRAAIKGSKLELSILNEGSSLPITTFYSNNDDEFMAIFTCDTTVETLFVGFLVQDDCSELMVDPRHPINLTFTDNLGLLKDKKLDEIAILERLPVSVVVNNNIAGYSFTFTNQNDLLDYFAAPNQFTISGTTLNDGTYTITMVTTIVANQFSVFVSQPTTAETLVSALIIVQRPLGNRNVSLFQIITACLTATGLTLPFNVYSWLHEINQDNAQSFLLQTYINPESFKVSEDAYDNCYQVLESIFIPLRLSLMQTDGKWELKKWDEAAYITPWEYFSFDANYGYIGKPNFDKYFSVGIGEPTVAETGLTRRIERPYEYSKETFNYEQRAGLICNSSLNRVGPLIQTTSNVTTRFDDYALAGFTNTNGNNAFIRVETDIVTDLEIQRYIYQPYYNGIDKDVSTCGIEVNAGDKFDFSVDYKWTENDNDLSQFRFIIQLILGNGDIYYLNSRSGVSIIPPFNWLIVGSSVNPFLYRVTDIPLTEWQTLSLKELNGNSLVNIPFDGKLYIHLMAANDTDAGKDGIMKGFKLDYYAFINETTKITGHTHTDTQDKNIKNNEEIDIQVDDSPRNSIAGTLFLSSITNGITNRTALWRRYPGDTQERKLGHIATYASLFARRTANTIIEGTFYGLGQNNFHMNPGAIVTYTHFPNSRFIFGRVEIDYRNDKLNFTLYELYDTTVDFDSLVQVYEFKYLYNTK